MPLVVHLPQLVRRRPLKPFKRFVSGARGIVDATMPMQDRRDRASARHWLVFEIVQPAANLAPAPGGMRVAHPQHQGFCLRRAAPRRVLRAARAIRQTRLALLPPARQQPIANRRADTKPPTQLATVHSFLLEQHHKLMPLQHDRLLRPRHPSLSPTGHRCR
jgi:hypothetical protein